MHTNPGWWLLLTAACGLYEQLQPDPPAPNDTTPPTVAPDDSAAPTDGPPTADSDPPIPDAFLEIDGLVAFEAEHIDDRAEETWTTWVAFTDGAPDPELSCRTNTSCGGGNAPDCNEYPSCDGDDTDPAEASGGTYLEALPDRRRTDDEPGTSGEIGVVNSPGLAGVLRYDVLFEQTGRYYVWVRARGQGPAANGLHVGIDGIWPRNDLVDPSTMRLQFRNGWRWSQSRRGGQQHTGVSGTSEVSVRDANVWLEVDEPGLHTIEFSMREDGFELDKVVLTLDPDFEPEGFGPDETLP